MEYILRIFIDMIFDGHHMNFTQIPSKYFMHSTDIYNSCSKDCDRVAWMQK